MQPDIYIKSVLTAIAFLLALIAFRPIASPAPALAGISSPEIYIEPGVYTLLSPDGMHQQLGKVVVDLHTGVIWGFPTGGNSPYPASAISSEPPVSTPFQLGKYDFKRLEH